MVALTLVCFPLALACATLILGGGQASAMSEAGIEHEKLKERMLSWWCLQPGHDASTAACEVPAHRLKISR